MTRIKRVLLVLGGIVSAFLLYQGVTTLVAYTNDAYVRSDLVEVAPQVTGRIVAVHVVDNQTVQQGDRLLDMDPAPFQFAVAEKQADIDRAQAQLGADRDNLAAAKDAQSAATAMADFARLTQQRAASLARSGDTSQAQLDAANDALTRAEATARERTADAARIQAQLAVHQATLQAAQAAMATARWQLERTQLVAPVAGTINNLTLQPGDQARVDEPLIGIVDANAWRIVANYKQSYLPLFKVGQTAWVWLDSQPWHFHRGRIAGMARGISRSEGQDKLLPYVAPTTDWIRLQHRFPVTITLVDPSLDPTLYMGSDARVVIFP